MTFNDPNRDFTTPRDAEAIRDGTSTTTWGLIALAAILIIGGLFFFNSSAGPDRTASNGPAITHSAPPIVAPAPAPVTAAPVTPKQ